MPESYIDGDHVIDDGLLFEDFAGLLFEVSVIDGNLPPVETHTVTFYVGEYGERIGGGELVQTVVDGETAVVPEVRTNEERMFIGWDGDVTAPVTDDITFTAMYHTAHLWLNFHCGDHGLIGIEGVREYDFSAFPLPYPYSGSLMWARIDENGEYTSDGNRYQFSLLSPPIIDYEGWHCIGWRNSEDGEFFPINNYDEEGGHLYSNAYVSVTLPVDSCLENSPEWVDFEPVYVEVEPPAETYAVTFDLGGHGARTGGGELVQSVPFGETAVAPLVLADEGWSFTGWDGDVTAAVTGDVVFSAQWERAKINVRINGEETICDYGDMVTFTAPEPWEADGVQIVTLGTTFTDPVVTNAFTVTVTNGFEFVWDIFATNWWFEVAETQNGSIAGAETGWIADGEEFILAAVPAEHYHFVGWTGDTEGCVETNGTELAVAMDHPRTVGAEFAIDTFTVTFEAGAHGALVGNTVQTIDYGGTAAVPAVASDMGYAFTGWSGDTGAPVVGDVTFTAQYATVPYAITYSGLKGAVNPNPATYTIEDAVTFAAPGEVYGWVFTGWTPASIAAGSTGSIEVTANWERAKFDATVNGETRQYCYEEEATFTAPEPWEADGVQIVTLGTTFTDPVVTNAFTVTVTNGFEFVWDIFATNWWFEVAETQNGSIAGAETGWIADGEEFILAAVPAEHYHFVGWTGDTEGCVETNGTELAVAMDHPRTVGAEFAIDTFTVTFEAGAHGSLVGEAVQTIDYGGTAAVPEVTSDVGYEFTGWSGDTGASVVGDATFTAQYATIPYAITYTGLKGAAHPNPATYTVEDTVTFAAPGEVDGWVFTGWTPASIALGSTGAIEVTANWERAKFNVTVNGETRQYSYEEEATFMAPEPWDADGVQIVTLGTTFTAPVLTNEFSLVVTSDISFEWDVCATNYWLEVAEPEHGSIVVAESGWHPAYSRVILEPVADEGYHFAGWTGDMADCALDGDMLAVEMRGPKSIGAEFALDIVAVIDGISPVSPSEDDAIILQGRAENGTAQEYLWRAVNMASGKASVIGRAQVCRAKLPMGEWRLEFLAKDLFGAWSAPASRDVTVSATTAAPDLQIARADVSFVDSLGLPTSHVKTGDAVAVRAVVVNRGAARLQNGAMVYLCDGIIPVADLAGLSRSDSRVIAQGTVSPLGAGRSQTVEFAWDVGRNAVGAVRAYDDGPNAFTVAVVPVGDAAQERTIENNLASMMLEIGESGESPSAMLRASANCHDQIWEGEEYSVSGYVWYERNEYRAMMAGASVLLSIDGEVVDETLTDAYGFYVCSFVAPPAGSHEAVIKAIDGTVVYSGACEFSSLERQGSGESGGEGAEPGIDVPVLRGANIAVAAVECTGVEVRRESAAAYAAYVDEDVGVRATILNTGDVAVTNGFVVSFLMTPEVGGSALQVDVAIADEILPGGTIVVACPETLTPQDEMRWVVRVVADAEDAVLEYSETDNSGRVWLAVKERRPNLVVTGISLSDQRPCDGTDEVVNVHVRNVGSAPVTESFAVELSVGDADRRMIVDGGLPVGGEATVETLVQLYDWMTRIVATADADGVIAEDDESDNSYSRTVLVYPVEANVSPVALSASTYPRAGQTCVLTATFRNDGGTAYSGGTAAFYDGDSAIGEGAVGPIAWKGGTGQATCAWTPAGNDDHSVRVVLDGKTYTVKFSKTPPPDLRVVADDISFEPGTPSAGEAVRFRAMVRNVGSSMPATDVSVAFSVAASDGIYRALTTMKVPTIAAGGSVAVDADMPFVVEQGVYSVQVAVCDGEGREADPADNLAVRTFGVNMPVASATAEATCIVGDTITLDGTGSTGATGFRWTLLEAPTGGISDVSGCTSAVASFVPHVAGVYRFALVVSDGTHESAPAECVVIIDRVRVAATASSGGAVSHDGEAVYAAGAVVVFEAIPETHYHFVGWTGDVDGCEAVGDLRLAVVMDCNRTIYAGFALDEIPVGEAANAPRLEWFSDGAAAWFGEWSADAADGEHAARSGAIGDNSSSVLGVKLHGAGTLAFDWRSSCEAKYDALRLEVDGKLLRNISGETGWKNVTVELGVGDHEVRWVYAKGRSRSEGQDAVWLDNVSWTPAGVPTLAEALGDFEWVTDGDVSWTAIRNEYAYEGDSFAYADGLGDYEYASLRTTVSGAGRLVFRWAVSCEYRCDWFDFMVDGEVQEMLTGETDWLEVSVDLADGPHEFEWVYWKDEMDDGEFAGANCAMLDYVQWFPAGEVPPEICEETVSEFFAWLKEHRRLEETDTAGDAAALVADKTPVSAKGMTLYQEFVAGTNPDDENDVFTAEIKVSADGVSVTPHPNLGDKRVYTLLGRKTLGGPGDDWVEVKDGEESNYNFFKVTVDIK